MKNVSSLIFSFYITVSSTFGQTQNLILTSEQNNKWLDRLTTLPIQEQLETIKERLLADTNVFIRHYYADRIRVGEQSGNRVYAEAKPTLIVDGYPMTIDNETKTFKIKGLIELLTMEYVKSIHVLSPDDPASRAIYGSAGLSGIIVMTLTKKKYLKKFLRIKINY
jgi:hypothetical protein